MPLSNDLTKGKPAKVLVSYSFPFILATFLQALFNITDIIVMGFYHGSAGSAGVGIGGQLTFLVTNGAIGLAAGATVVVGKYFGAGDTKRVKTAVINLFIVFVIMAAVLSVIVFFLGEPFALLMRTPGEAFAAAVDYVKISALGLVFVFIYNGVSAVIRGLGNSVVPLLTILFACIVNLGLDILFIGYLDMGGRGAAWATVISQALSAILAVVIYVKKRKIKVRKIHLRLDAGIVKELFKVGVPLAVLNMTATISFMALTFTVNTLPAAGVYQSAAHVIAARYNGFAVLPSRAMASAISAVTAQNIGAGMLERNKKTLFTGMSICLAVGAALFAVTFFFPDIIYKLFGAEAATAAEGRLYMKAISFDYVLLPLGVTAYGLVEGFQNTGVTMTVNIIGSLAVRAPAAFLLGKIWGLGLMGIGISIPLASLVSAVLVWIFILKRKYLSENPNIKCPSR